MEVPLPRVRDENEAVSGVAEARLQPAAHGAGDVVARDRRVSVVQDARDGADLFAVRAREAREERVERVAARVLDRDVP